MADQANITSLEALDTLRASLIVFANKAHTRLDEVGDEVRRTKSWLQHDRRIFWQTEIRRRRTKLDQAEGELMTARMSSMRENYTLQQLAVRKAKESLNEGEVKLRAVMKWSRDFEATVEPLSRKLETMRGVLDHEIPKALSFLLQLQKTLEEYTEMVRPTERSASPAQPAAESSETSP